MECKRLPVDSEIRDFTLKIIVLNKNSGLVVSLKRKKPALRGRLRMYCSARLCFTF